VQFSNKDSNEQLDLKKNQYLEPLQTSFLTRVALHRSGEASTTPLTKTPGHLHNLLEGIAVSTPPSHLGGSNLQE
jgi:hypothetical protein